MMTLMTLITALVTMMITLMTRKGGGQAQRVNYSSPINGSHAGAGTLLPDYHYHPSLKNDEEEKCVKIIPTTNILNDDDEKYVNSISTTNQGGCQISNVKESMCFSTTKCVKCEDQKSNMRSAAASCDADVVVDMKMVIMMIMIIQYHALGSV